MKTITATLTACILGLAISPCLTSAAESPNGSPPNFILIVSDDAGYVDFGFMGSKEIRTPYLDKLARQGVRFGQAYAGPTCSPSRCGLLSGHYSQRHGFGRNCGARFDEPNDGFPRGVMTLPALLKARGYATGVVGKWHQGAVEGVNQPLDLGFDEFWGLLGGGRHYFGNAGGAAAMWRNRTPDPEWVKRASKIDPDPDKGRYVTDAIGDEAIAMLKRLSAQEKPFYIYMSFTAPHTPLQAKQQDLAQFPDLPPKRRTQAAMQLAMDRASGRLLEHLDQLDEADNTYVVFLNDNGGSLLSGINGPLRAQKGTVYEGGVRVPMILRGPGIPKGTDYDRVVVHRDLLPTFLALAGSDIPHGLDGVNLIPHLVGENTNDPHPMIIHRHVSAGVAVRSGNWKMVNPKNPGEHGKNDPGHWELYDLASDPSESIDLSGRYPDRVDELKQAIADWERTLTKNRWGQFGKQDRNYFDSFTFSSAAGGNWFDQDAWHKTGDSKHTARMSCQDLYPNAVLEFPLTEEGYEATNNLYSASGLNAMLNRLKFTGKGHMTMAGNPLRFVASLAGQLPQIAIPAGGHATLELPLEADAPLTVSGDGAVTISGSFRAPAVTVSNRHFHLECDAHTGVMKLKSTTLNLRSKQVVDGVLALDSGVYLSVNLNQSPTQKTLVLKADRITGAFTNTDLKMNGLDYRVIVDGGRVFIAPR
jgi:arylsulfatase A-like enzyme